MVCKLPDLSDEDLKLIQSQLTKRFPKAPVDAATIRECYHVSTIAFDPRPATSPQNNVGLPLPCSSCTRLTLFVRAYKLCSSARANMPHRPKVRASCQVLFRRTSSINLAPNAPSPAGSPCASFRENDLLLFWRVHNMLQASSNTLRLEVNALPVLPAQCLRARSIIRTKI